MMVKMHWFETHLGSKEEALKVINEFKWNIQISRKDGNWLVTTGDKEKHILLSTASQEVVDAFIYGMALAYVGIPENLFDQLVADLSKWYENL